MNFTGLLIKESLKDISVLTLVKITKQEMWNVGNATDDQPKVWHALWFEGPNESANEIAEALAQNLKSDQAWYTNFTADKIVYVIFPGKVFSYSKGDQTGRIKVETYAKSIGIPASQLDWTE